MEIGPVAFGAGIAAAATIIVGLAMGWLQRLVRRAFIVMSRAIRADHWAIKGGWFTGDLGAQSNFLVSIKCAPSRSFRSPVRLDPEAVAVWMRVFGDVFPSAPEYCSPTELIRYRSESEATREATVLIWPSGLLEAALPLPHSLDEDGQPQIALLDIARPVISVIGSIQAGAHGAMFGNGVFGRLRLDWCIGVSRALTKESWTPWTRLLFPGRVPKGRATGMQPPMPSCGFGQERLVNLPPKSSVARILVPVLTDLIERSGYFGYEESVIDIERAIQSLSTVEVSFASRP